VQIFKFDPDQEIPVVTALIRGPRTAQKVRLVFDTGSGITQIDTGVIDDIGYSVASAEYVTNIRGPIGDTQPGYVLPTESFTIFGLIFKNLKVGAFDFDNFAAYDIDGLLGFDIIKQLHLEMNGPQGELRIF